MNECPENLKEAVEALRNFGVSLNDYDSDALDMLLEWVETQRNNIDAELARRAAEINRMRKDAERYRALKPLFIKKTAYDVYGDGALWKCQFFADDGELGLNKAVDALVASAGSGRG